MFFDIPGYQENIHQTSYSAFVNTKARHAPQWYKISQPMERSPTDGRTLSLVRASTRIDSLDSRQRERNKGESLTARPVTQYRAYRSALGNGRQKLSRGIRGRARRRAEEGESLTYIPLAAGSIRSGATRLGRGWSTTKKREAQSEHGERGSDAEKRGRDGDLARNALASSLIIR